MEQGLLKIQHRYGIGNCADLFAKFLSTKDFLRLRSFLDFESTEQPIDSLVAQVEDMSVDQFMTSNALNFAFAEVCCLEESCLNLACEIGYSLPRYCSKHAKG